MLGAMPLMQKRRGGDTAGLSYNDWLGRRGRTAVVSPQQNLSRRRFIGGQITTRLRLVVGSLAAKPITGRMPCYIRYVIHMTAEDRHAISRTFALLIAFLAIAYGVTGSAIMQLAVLLFVVVWILINAIDLLFWFLEKKRGNLHAK